MSSKKATGAYYTPEILADFLVSHLIEKYLSNGERLKILEPSVGDGRFLKPITEKDYLNNYKFVQVDIVEKNVLELQKATEILKTTTCSNFRYNSYCGDFLDFTGKKYDLIIGNPPYINKRHLSKDQIDKCKKLEELYIHEYGETKNIWPAFIFKSIQHLRKDGIICLILPSELLQVKYTKKIREYLLEEFERIEIFAFNELIFKNEKGGLIEQDVVVFIGIKRHKNKKEKGVSFYQVEQLKDLEIPGYVEKNSNIHRSKLDKWTNYILEDSELDFIQSKVEELNLKPIKYYCEKAEVGIVTAANKFFIVNNTRIKKYSIKEYAKPIISRGSFIKDKLVLQNKDIEKLNELDKPVNFLDLNINGKELSHAICHYIKIGERAGLSNRYKMKRREKWYKVPYIWSPDGVFVKRSHLFPRIVINQTDSLFTDSFYRIKMKEDYEIKDLAFSFYNSLSYILAELEGRYYGGGVLELTPNEFKNSMIPYVSNVSKSHLRKLNKLLSENSGPEEILNFTDSIILNSFTNIELEKLRSIRKKLVARRLKKERLS
ncbi:Eco57I restriction-modification methylase domain-containing protein [Gracilimonas sp.]|uniref:Eco57I restriction-modification methylase domain-containing protein n=1 Tax=Gracilimonas sp. TaxID=1974203 RepID=UPI003BAA16C8